MKVTVITSSGHKNGTSRTLAENFINGAKERGHEVYRFDAGLRNIHPCIGCGKCKSLFKCVFDDDMSVLRPHLLDCDVLVLASPVYYFDFNAQMKRVIDRFYANNEILKGDKKVYLLATMADSDEKTGLGMKVTFECISEYMEWDIGGEIIAPGVADTASDNLPVFAQKAYEMGNNL